MPHPKEIEPVHAEALALDFARRILNVNHNAAHYTHAVTRNDDGSLCVRFTPSQSGLTEIVILDNIVIPLKGIMAGIITSSSGLRKEAMP